ncbi:molybdopterin-dependent oxidoreductase [Patulibacter defluvii]|uniref:molybdopterin-dependent oxidoreductase n=1 Tax=Patulibacter defluvii TaxID=3095358 RepID=UPI002A75A834|nr:molybdopterin-dependent oxidoreductase [Patulibacter sp. DM4]
MTHETPTYCRICEALCGLVATVEDGTVTKLRPDPQHPISQGFACPKGIAMPEVQNDPDRVLHPQRRRPDGRFERVTWEEAIADIGARLRAIRREHGSEALGFFLGNPLAFSYSAFMWVKGFVDALDSPHFYSSSSQDTNSRLVASALLYGSPLHVPIPDLGHTDFALLIGANPLVSHGSLVSGIDVRKALKAVVARGGRVVVADPRRTETAKQFEHLPVLPGCDAWMLLSLLHVIFAEGLEDRQAIARGSSGAERLRAWVAPFPPEATADRSGVPAEVVRQLARDLAAAPSAVVYGRVGACTTDFGTLVNVLLDALAAVTGNADRRGGTVFPTPPIDLYEPLIKRGLDSYGSKRSRIGDLPDVLGSMPAAILADEITTPGRGQLRAMVVAAGNPVLSVPDGARLERALGELDLLVALDFGRNQTNRHADYLLPTTTWLEREDLPMAMFAYQVQPFVHWTEPVVAPRGEARQEWQILDALARELGIVPSSLPSVRRLGPLARRLLRPRRMADAMLRTGPYGDRFGLRRDGISVARIRQRHPHGAILADAAPVGVLPDRLTTADRRIALAPPAIADEIARLSASAAPSAAFPLRLFGRRELRSINSWMKNARKLRVRERGPTLLIHPDDAAAAGLTEGGPVRVVSAAGAVETTVEVTDSVMAGTVNLPHGWEAVNYNALTAAGADSVERISGMSILSGVHVRVEAVG